MAFDTVTYHIILDRLDNISSRDVAYSFTTYFLANISQMIKINNTFSNNAWSASGQYIGAYVISHLCKRSAV